MVTEPAWLRTVADASSVLLLLELCFALLIITALMLLLAYGARWLRLNVAPVLSAATPRARQALRMADAGTERVARGVAEVYGIRQAVEAGLRALWHGAAVDVLAQSAPGATDGAAAPTEAPVPPAAAGGAAPPPGGQQPGRQRPTTPPREPRQPAGGRDTGGIGAHAG
jgi:hypothetical protein